jgi:hypothetical protein
LRSAARGAPWSTIEGELLADQAFQPSIIALRRDRRLAGPLRFHKESHVAVADEGNNYAGFARSTLA